MRTLEKMRQRLRSLLRRKRVEQELDEELRFHLELLIQENVAAGMSHNDARFAAKRAIGGVAQFKEECRDMRRINLVDSSLKDICYAVRTLKGTPTFTLVSLVTLALGIGATAAIFTVVNGVMLQPLQYSEPHRLVTVWETNSTYNFPGQPAGSIRFSPGNYLDLRDQNRAFERIGALTTDSYNLTGGGSPERVVGALVSASLLSTLSIQPALGRMFVHSDDAPSADRVVILGHGLWSRRFGGNPGVIGTSLRLDDRSHIIIGVMPSGVRILNEDADLWLPLERKLAPERMRWRESYYLGVIARLKPGVSFAQANQDVDRVVQGIRRVHPGDLGKGAAVVPLLDQTVAPIRRPLSILFGAVGFVLLIACANVANLSLGRAGTRHREIAVRLALGASRGRLVRQLFTESLVLALCGAALGLCLAKWGVSALLKLAPNEIPRAADIHVDAWVVGFTLIAATAAGIIFGLFPAIAASRSELQGGLNSSGRSSSAGPGTQRARSTLVVSEIAIALVLLIGAGLMIESFRRVLAVDPGFDPRGLISMRVPLSETKYADIGQQVAFYRELLDRVSNMPGVKSFGIVDGLPFADGGFDNSFSIDGRPAQPAGRPLIAEIRRVDPRYFPTMGMTLLQGRAFNEGDRTDAPPVVIISQSMARRYWPNETPVGKLVTVHFGPPSGLRAEIAGLVSDVRTALDAKPRDYIYLHYPQGRHVTEMYLVLRLDTHGGNPDAGALVNQVRSAVSSLDPDQPVYRVRRMEEILASSLATRSFEMVLLGSLAALAVCLAAIGLYGVLAYSVQVRTREIGIRTALGARNSQVFGMVLRQAVKLTSIGVAAGLLGAFALTRVLSMLLFEVKATDPTTFAAVSLLLFLVALASGYFPARHAASVDPMIALRHE